MAGTVHGQGRVRFFSGNPTGAGFDDLARHGAEGKLNPAVDTAFPMGCCAYVLSLSIRRASSSGASRWTRWPWAESSWTVAAGTR
ncbi:hypothetical protein SAM23877_7367 [Streptomyces ambofaciens ATCC 23877]|uniref:Uncharacterized protein n=1 Tax=Streptomyces ambofaciens (strain ATCC 23877 / 3486 / DSM 40053 / JCM 4204 / NBRC 12836 / NRRL B-2516) TaxID=278992 RepID=A0A0K2B590_STRA7|nr:hypothetical protein SAM23877_7367 [Streptomyces ambofaciens ATCC 23877]